MKYMYLLIVEIKTATEVFQNEVSLSIKALACDTPNFPTRGLNEI